MTLPAVVAASPVLFVLASPLRSQYHHDQVGMLFWAFALYVLILLVAITATYLLPQHAGPLLGVTMAFAVFGAVLLYLIYRRQPAAGVSRVARTYLRRLEAVVADFAKSKSLERQVVEMAAYLVDELQFQCACVFTRKRTAFLPAAAFGLDQKLLRDIRVPKRGGLVSAMESSHTALKLDRFYQSAGGNPFHELQLEYVLPIVFAGKCSHFIVTSNSGYAPFQMLHPFLLALSDQLGHYHRVEELRERHGQQMGKVKRQLKSLEQQLEREKGGAEFDVGAIVAAQDRLMRIFDRKQLYPALLSIFVNDFKADVAVTLAVGESAADYSIAHRQPASYSKGADFSFPADSPLVDLLEQTSRPLALASLEQRAGNLPEIQGLLRLGLTHLATVSDTKMGKVVIGVGRQRQPLSAQEIEGADSLLRLLNLVLANIGHYERIEEMSYTDSMTGLYNYRYFYKRLREEIFRARRFTRTLALVIFDIDGFKVFNDSYGHQSGDYLLEQLGSLLVNSVRSIDVVSRYGGEEFCVIMPEADRGDCLNFMERMRVKILDQEFEDRFTDDRHRITVSLGGAIYPNDAQRVDRLIYCADLALLEAKNSGRNKAFMFAKSFVEKKQVL